MKEIVKGGGTGRDRDHLFPVKRKRREEGKSFDLFLNKREVGIICLMLLDRR